MRHSALVVVAVCSVMACSGASPDAAGRADGPAYRTCAAEGCDSELVVSVDGADAGPVRVEVRVQGRDAYYVATCPADREGGCSGDYRFPAFTPAAVDIRVVTPAGVARRTVEHVVYHDEQPNGPQCTPTCRQAFLRVDAPRAP